MYLRTILTMKLNKLEATGSPDYIRLSFDDGSTMRVPVSVVGDLGLYAGLTMSDADMDALGDAAGRASAKLRAVRIVASSAISERELRRRLVSKGERQDFADEAVDWLTGLNLVDDADTAKQIVRRGIAKGYGKARLKQMLYEKGIGKEHWGEALAEVPDMEEAIDRYLSAHLRPGCSDRKEIKKITDALLRRGHSWEDIRAGLQRHSATIEED